MTAAVCGELGQSYGWHLGFGLAGIGMLIGLMVFMWGQRFLGGAAEPPDPVKLREPFLLGLSREWLVYLATPLAVGLAWLLVQQGEVLGMLLHAVCAATLLGLIYYVARRTTAEERGPMSVAVVLIVFSTVFWAFFEQAGSSMALFTERNVDRTVFGTTVAPAVFASVNSAYVLLFSPVLIWLWQKLGPREPSTPMKFGLGTVQLGLGFGAMWLGATGSQATGIVPLSWLLLGIALHTTGELCLSPVGLSMVTKLSPQRIVGVMMGAWFLASAEAQYAASLIARLTGVKDAEQGDQAVAAAKTVMVYGSVFGGIALTALAVGLLLCLLSPFLTRRMGGVR
jgi:POT family proton-dependent oligopeptide transporter